MLTPASCDLFNLPFFQFAQLKKYQPESIVQIKADYKSAWQNWKTTINAVARQLGTPFAPPHIEKWCNGWQVRAHFFAYFKYEYHQNSAAILSVLLNRRRLSVSLDWHCYRADRSQITLSQYNQWLEHFDPTVFSHFDLWHGDESEYADFTPISQLKETALQLRNEQDFFCIGRNVEHAQLAHIDSVDFIAETIRGLLPLYESCHQT